MTDLAGWLADLAEFRGERLRADTDPTLNCAGQRTSISGHNNV